MQIRTTRFGTVTIDPADVLSFPHGLIGFRESQRFVLLPDTKSGALGWLQSCTQSELALAVVSPRRFVPNYQVRVAAGLLGSLQLEAIDRAYILCVVAPNDGQLTMNLRAPLVINLDRRLGRQIVTTDEQPLQYALSFSSAELRKAA